MSDGYRTWTEADIEEFEADPPVGSRARFALGLIAYTGQRRADVVRMGAEHIRNGAIYASREDRPDLWFPVHPVLEAILEATPGSNVRDHQTRQAVPPAGFTNGFATRARCRGALLPAHGLRKAAARRLAEAGCTAHEIGAITGHASLREVARYTEAADRRKLAASAMAKVKGGTSSG